MNTVLTDLLDLQAPLLQAPMAGVSTPALAAAVSRAGALGAIAVGAMTADAADAAIGEALRACSGPLNVNLFAHAPARRNPEREAEWLRRLEPWFAEFDAAPPRTLGEIYPTMDAAPDLLAAVLDHRPAVVSLHFGLPEARTLQRLRAAGATLVATATSVAEARHLAAAGIDVIVAQGWEAGGHRGVFDPARDDRLPTFELLPRVVDAVRIPVVAAGGLASGADIARALALGAAGVQLGTVFAGCPESAAGDAYRRALADPNRTTAMTPVVSGRPARSLRNRFVRELADLAGLVPDYPVAYDAGKALAAAAARAGTHDFDVMWCGAGPVRDDALPATGLVRALMAETDAALA